MSPSTRTLAFFGLFARFRSDENGQVRLCSCAGETARDKQVEHQILRLAHRGSVPPMPAGERIALRDVWAVVKASAVNRIGVPLLKLWAALFIVGAVVVLVSIATMYLR